MLQGCGSDPRCDWPLCLLADLSICGSAALFAQQPVGRPRTASATSSQPRRFTISSTQRSGSEPSNDLVEQELRVALKVLAQRIRFLAGQIDDIENRLRPIVAEHFLALLGLHGVGPHSAAQVLIADGDNADRMHSEAAFAKLCGACPQPAS